MAIAKPFVSYASDSDNEATFQLSSLYYLSDLQGQIAALWEDTLIAEGLGAYDEKTKSYSVENEIASLLDCKKKECFYTNSSDNRLYRKAFLTDYIAPYWKPKSIKTSIVPAKSFVKRVIKLTSLLYKNAAVRKLNTDNQAIIESFETIYRDASANRFFKTLLRKLKLHNYMLVHPVTREIDGEHTFCLDSYTPDCFRVKLDNAGNIITVLYASTFPTIDKDGIESVQNCIVVWTKDKHYIRDMSGEIVTNYDNPDNINPYDFIPFELICLEDAPLYEGGNDDLIESNLTANYLELLSLQDSTYAAINLLIYQNLNLTKNQTISPKTALGALDIMQGEGQPIPPDAKFISGDPHIQEFITAMNAEEKKAGRREGLSNTLLSDTVQELSGKALKYSMYELLEYRQDDSETMLPIEKRIFRKSAMVLDVDRSKYSFYPNLKGIIPPDRNLLTVDFAEITFEDDAKLTYELDRMKVADSILSRYDFYRNYNTDLTDDKEILARMLQNKKDNAQFESMGFKSALLNLSKGKVDTGV